MWRTQAKTVALCTLDPDAVVESLRRVRCAGNIYIFFFPRPEDLKTLQHVLWVFLSPALIAVPVWNRSTRRPVVPWWWLTWRLCGEIRDRSHILAILGHVSLLLNGFTGFSLTLIYSQTWEIYKKNYNQEQYNGHCGSTPGVGVHWSAHEVQLDS